MRHLCGVKGALSPSLNLFEWDYSLSHNTAQALGLLTSEWLLTDCSSHFSHKPSIQTKPQQIWEHISMHSTIASCCFCPPPECACYTNENVAARQTFCVSITTLKAFTVKEPNPGDRPYATRVLQGGAEVQVLLKYSANSLQKSGKRQQIWQVRLWSRSMLKRLWKAAFLRTQGEDYSIYSGEEKDERRLYKGKCSCLK